MRRISVVPSSNLSTFTFNPLARLARKAERKGVIYLRADSGAHLTRIMRITSFIIVYAAGTYAGIVKPEIYNYIQPWLDLAEACALANFYLLICRFLASNRDSQGSGEVELEQVYRAPMFALQALTGDDWPLAAQKNHKSWFFVFQYPIVCFVVAVLTCISEAHGVFCYNDSSPHFAHLWLNIASKTSIVFAVNAVIFKVMKLREELKAHRCLLKLLAFKLLIGLQFILQVRSHLTNSLSLLRVRSPKGSKTEGVHD